MEQRKQELAVRGAAIRAETDAYVRISAAKHVSGVANTEASIAMRDAQNQSVGQK